MPDTRFCYGATCTWFGSIHEIGTKHRLPACPYCKGMLFEMATEAVWWNSVKVFEDAGHPGYRAMLEWQRKLSVCYPARLGGIETLAKEYKASTGITVKYA